MSAPAARPAGPAGARPAWRTELLRALALALASGTLYALTFQTRYFGDGPGLAALHALGAAEHYYHLLYLPLCDLLARVLGSADPFVALRLLSILPAALGVGLGYLVLRAMGAPVFGALTALGLVALSPSLWFFGTTIEVHALLFGTVALVAALTLHAPWRRPGLALALVTLAFPLLYCAHQAAFVLGPGWVLLVAFARARHARPFPWPKLVLGVGPLLLAALLAAALLGGWLRFGSLARLRTEVAAQLSLQQAYAGDFPAPRPVWRDEWLLPLGVLVPLALAGAARLWRERRLAAAIGALTLVPTAFFLWWGVYERGGYFLGCALFLAVPAAFLLGRASRAKLALALVLLAGQGTLAWRALSAYDRGWDPAERAAQVRAAIGTQGLLLASTDLAPDIRCDLPQVEEFSLLAFIRATCVRERRLVTPEEISALQRPLLARLLQRQAHVAVELGYTRVAADDSPSIAAFTPHLAALEALLRELYVVRELPHPYWPLLVLEGPR